MATPQTALTELFLLGTVAISGRGGVPVSIGIAGTTLELFAYFLTFSHRPMRRDHLADLLWEDLDPERSRAALNTAIWRVRQTVRRMRGIALYSDAKVVRMDIDETVKLDTARLKGVMQTTIAAFTKENGLPSTLRGELHDVLARFDGDFLEGSNSSWVLVEREEYVNLRLRGLTMLMQDAGIRRVYEDALAYGRRILAVDPFREAVQCEMLWLYMMSGRRAFAIRHYREYEEMLRRELGIAPMAETRVIYEMVCTDASPPKPPIKRCVNELVPSPAAMPGIDLLLGEIEKDRRSFYRSHFAPSA